MGAGSFKRWPSIRRPHEHHPAIPGNAFLAHKKKLASNLRQAKSSNFLSINPEPFNFTKSELGETYNSDKISTEPSMRRE
jgi:hypothetical protein